MTDRDRNVYRYKCTVRQKRRGREASRMEGETNVE